MLNLHAAARAILLEDGQDPRRDLGPPVHSWGMWSGIYIDEDPRFVTRVPMPGAWKSWFVTKQLKTLGL
jgi:hypothetical protein